MMWYVRVFAIRARRVDSSRMHGLRKRSERQKTRKSLFLVEGRQWSIYTYLRKWQPYHYEMLLFSSFGVNEPLLSWYQSDPWPLWLRAIHINANYGKFSRSPFHCTKDRDTLFIYVHCSVPRTMSNHKRWSSAGPFHTQKYMRTTTNISSKQHSWWACAAHRPDFLQSFNRKVPAIFLFISCSPYRARFRVIKINKLSLSWFLCAAAEKHIRFLICVAVGDTRPILYSLLLFFSVCVIHPSCHLFSPIELSLSLSTLSIAHWFRWMLASWMMTMTTIFIYIWT